MWQNQPSSPAKRKGNDSYSSGKLWGIPHKKTLKDFIHLLNEERILIIRAIVGKPDTKNKDDYSPDKRERIFNNQGNYG